MEDGTVEDLFVIVDRETHQSFEDNRLEGMAEVVLQASKMGPQFLSPTTRWKELEDRNEVLEERIRTLEGALLKRRRTVVTK